MAAVTRAVPWLASALLLASCAGEPATTPSDAPDAGSPDATMCTPGVALNECPSSASVTQCAADGATWVEVACDTGLFCFAGACVDHPCAPGDVVCADPKSLHACLADGAGSYGWQQLESCPGLCHDGACVDACGFDPKFGATTPCEHFIIDLTGSPENGCSDPGLLVVPSSGDDRLAVFDVSADPPVPVEGSPFETCDDPSRVMMTDDGTIVATCRGDGHVRAHSPDGDTLWDIQLPECAAVRGAVLGPDGRLFAGCTSSGRVHEVDLADGSILGTVKTGLDVYGMAADSTGIYVLDGDTLAKIDVSGGTLTTWWAVESAGYGLATDGEGRVWVTQPPGLALFDGVDGELIQSVAISVGDDPWIDGHCNGVAVARDGRVVAGCADSGDFLVVWDPAAEGLQVLGLPSGHAHPRGVAIDHAGHSYAINMTSQTVVRFDRLTGAATPFGENLLTQPYGYSGDMTALVPCHLAGTATWTSPVLAPSDGLVVRWIAIQWRADEPADTEVAVSYRLADGPWVRILSGMPIQALSETLQIRAELRSWSADAVPILHELAVFHAEP